jgi:hypothetical protein
MSTKPFLESITKDVALWRMGLILLKHTNLVFFHLGKGEINHHRKTNVSSYRGLKKGERGSIT